MSTEITDVVVPANVAPTESTPEPSSFAELRKSWTPEQRQKWDTTGEEPTVPAKTETVVPETQPEPVKAKVEPASGAGEEDQEPEYYGTPEQQKAQKHAFARLKRERAEARAEAKILREQLAGRQPAVPAAAPKAEPKPQAGLVKPVRPRLTDAKYQVEGGIEAYDADVEAYEDARDSYREAKAKADREAAEAENELRSREELWANEVKAGVAEHGDAFRKAIYDLPVSFAVMGVLMGMKGGAQVYYHLAQNPEIAQQLSLDTEIAGTFQTYEELAAAAEKNPALARQLGAAEALVRAEAKRILSGSTKTPDPKPITVSRTVAPAEKVNASASVSKDPIQAASEMYDKTGDHKYLREMNRLMDQRDREALRRS